MTTKPTILSTTLEEANAAAYIGMSRSWLRQSRCLKFHHAPPYIQLGHRIRYRITDLDVWKTQYAHTRDRYRRKNRLQTSPNS